MEKDIQGFENYTINTIGEVYSKRSQKTLKPSIDKDGYLLVSLSNSGKKKKISIHRLVALNFIANPDKKPQVNHINGIKSDNRLENLEWVTASENIVHSWTIGLSDKCRKVLSTIHNRSLINMENGVFYGSIKEAAEKENINYSTLKAMLTGQNKNKTSLQYRQTYQSL
jgi:HNH endonuclease